MDWPSRPATRSPAAVGLADEVAYMHDLASLTLLAAIERHTGEAREVTHRFKALTATQQQQQIIVFLNSL